MDEIDAEIRQIIEEILDPFIMKRYPAFSEQTPAEEEFKKLRRIKALLLRNMIDYYLNIQS